MTKDEQRNVRDHAICEQITGMVNSLDIDSIIPEAEKAKVKESIRYWRKLLEATFKIRSSRAKDEPEQPQIV